MCACWPQKHAVALAWSAAGNGSTAVRSKLRVGEDELRKNLRREIEGPLTQAYASRPQAAAALRFAPAALIGDDDVAPPEDDLPAEREYERVARRLLTIRHPRQKRVAKNKFKLKGVVTRKRAGALWGNSTWSRTRLAKEVRFSLLTRALCSREHSARMSTLLTRALCSREHSARVSTLLTRANCSPDHARANIVARSP